MGPARHHGIPVGCREYKELVLDRPQVTPGDGADPLHGQRHPRVGHILDSGAVVGPLGEFQAQPLSEEGLRAVVVSINTRWTKVG